MLDIAMNPEMETKSRVAIGAKLLDKFMPPKVGPIVQVNNRKTYNIVSHLNIPTAADTAAQIRGSDARALPPKKEPVTIEATAFTDRTYPKHQPAPAIVTEASALETLPPDSKDSEPFERAPNPFERKGQEPKPRRRPW
jgi:hypothetical protein